MKPEDRDSKAAQSIIAKCGYRCDLCTAFEGNLRSDWDKWDFQRALMHYYDCAIPFENITPCKGCQDAAESPDKNCEVFPCVQQKGIPHCGHCREWAVCSKLKHRMDVVEDVFTNQDNVPPDDYDRYFKPYLSRGILTQSADGQG